MATGGNVTYTCKECGRKFIGWASAKRVYCSRECADANAKGRALKHGESRTRLYCIWCDMKDRCNNHNAAAFSYYGGRGISVCVEWEKDYVAFRDWAHASGYEPHLELDRIDPNGSYEPSNCRWATRTQQMANTRKRRLKRGTKSRFKGAVKCTNTSGKPWRAIITIDKRPKHLGVFQTQLEAALAYDDAAHAMYGEFARLNFPERKRKVIRSLVGKKA